MPQTAIVQARTTSRRLPGKVLRAVAGKPLLEYLLERLERCRLVTEVFLATSDDPSDDELASLCARLGVAVYRGSLNNVVARFLALARKHNLASFVRVNGDSPLLDPAIVDRGVALFDTQACDLVTNVFPRTYPKGQSVEVVSTAALERVAALSADPEDLEHVTRYFYGHPDEFRITNFAYGLDAGGVQLSVDSAEDLARLELMVGRMTRPHWDYGLDELLSLSQHRALS